MTSPVPDQPTILVVEDDPTINTAITDRLVAEGFRVVQAFDGPTAVSAAESHRPDAVVLADDLVQRFGIDCAAAFAEPAHGRPEGFSRGISWR